MVKKRHRVNGELVTADAYNKTRYEDLRVRVPIGKKAEVQAHAAKMGDDSLNAFIARAIDATMETDNNLKE